MPFPDVGIGPADLRERLEALRGKELNFDAATGGGPGWHHDDYRQPLPPEQPGPPEPDASWEVAKRLSHAYAFADPSLVGVYFDDEVRLERRDMLLVLHALGLRIYAGVRVGAAGEETRKLEGRAARVSFWNYRTLEGHVEAGQRDYEVAARERTGALDRTFPSRLGDPRTPPSGARAARLLATAEALRLTALERATHPRVGNVR
jgi:Domain of unknown function (DUF1990)